MENVELSSRLSAFDSFLFLVPDDEKQDGASAKNELQSNSKIRVTAATDSGAAVVGADAGGNKVLKEYSTTTAMDEDEYYNNMPIHESNVRCIPGSAGEKQEMLDKLSPFDPYMFLLDGHASNMTAKKNKIAKNGVVSEEAARMALPIPRKSTMKVKTQGTAKGVSFTPKSS